MADKLKVSSAEPCKICGKPDYCFRLRFEEGNTLHCCARVDAKTAVSSGGIVYVYKKFKDTDIGTYTYYQEEEEYKRSLEKFKRSKGLTYSSGGYRRRVEPIEKSTGTFEKGTSLIIGESPIADDERLDKVLRRFLELMTLEKRDYELLKADWNSPATGDLISKVLSIYPIRTLPPSDDVRNRLFFEKMESPLRKEVCSILIKEFGTLEGIPPFFLDENGEWDIAGPEGIMFPIYSKDGKLVRVRGRESYPQIKGMFEGEEGIFSHFYTKKGEHCWTFKAENSVDENPIYVYSPYSKRIQLKKDGCPAGKAAGKYKNLSSVWEKRLEDGTIINGYGSKGTRSGSNASLYCRPTDNFSTVYVTEGEKKAMIANLLLGVPTISLPGTGCFSMIFKEDEDGNSIASILAEKGCNLFVIAYDADKGTNVKVLKAEQAAIEEFKKRNFKIAVGEWNANFGKGLDDILVTGVRPSIYLCA